MSKLVLGESLTPEQVGWKAYRLSELIKQKFPVPKGFVINQPLAIHELTQMIEFIGGFPVAVRSSGSVEDLEGASFAGLYESFLDQKSILEVQDSIVKCFEAIHAPRVKQYLADKKASHLDVKMQVLIQKMVEVDRAGVLFTLPPTTGKEEHFYIEVVHGLGESLVSGTKTPTQIYYDFESEKIQTQILNSDQTEMSLSELKKLSLLSLEIQANEGQPQDIEWAIDKDGKIWILQTRPITHINWRDDVLDHTNADLKDGGISARVCTPLMFSLYEAAMEESMSSYFMKLNLIKQGHGIKWISHFYGRAYWNAGAVKNALSVLPDFNEKSFDQDLGIQKDYGELGPRKTKLSLTSLFKAIPVLIGLYQEFDDCLKFNKHFKKMFEIKDEDFKKEMKNWTKLSAIEFNEKIKSIIYFQHETEKAYFRTIYNNANYQTEFKSLLKKWDKEESIDRLKLMSGLTEVSHLKIQNELIKVAQNIHFFGKESLNVKKAVEKFLKENYHHGDVELDLTVPRWGEVPNKVVEMAEKVNPFENLKINQKDWLDEWEKLNRQHTLNLEWKFFGRKKFLKSLNKLRSFLIEREEMRSLSTRAYYLVRIGLLEWSKKNNIENVFMLKREEILTHQLPSLHELKTRLLKYNGYRKMKVPNEFGGDVKQVDPQNIQGSLKGVGCSSGVYTGIAFVAKNLHETEFIKREEILVTFFTDPGWTPVLARVSGVVTEVGGVLSHAAVIGREYGIPAVLNVVGATDIIKTGDKMMINGKTGEIKILEKSS